MKKTALILISLILCAVMTAMTVSADAIMGTWTKDSDTKYSVANHQNGNDYFDYYELGNADNVTLSAKITIGDGKQVGFMFGVTDVNNDGKIKEGSDQYYLLDYSGLNINLERNDKNWGGWAKQANPGKASNSSVVLKVAYNRGAVKVYVDDILQYEYIDQRPFSGTSFGLCAKTDSVFENVTIDTQTPVDFVVGAGSVDTSKATDNANWTVDGDKYTLNITENGYGNAKFATYALGNSDKKVTLTADFTVAPLAKWGPDNGGDSGFLFAISDMNGDGNITEGGDYYYLVDIGANGDFVGIERNAGGWGDWIARTNNNTGNLKLETGKTYSFSATFDPEAGTITASIDGVVVLEYTDAHPFSGTGYALASKTYGATIANVTVDDGTVTDDDTTDDENNAKTGDESVLFLVLSAVTLFGTAIIVGNKRRVQD